MPLISMKHQNFTKRDQIFLYYNKYENIKMLLITNSTRAKSGQILCRNSIESMIVTEKKEKFLCECEHIDHECKIIILHYYLFVERLLSNG